MTIPADPGTAAEAGRRPHRAADACGCASKNSGRRHRRRHCRPPPRRASCSDRGSTVRGMPAPPRPAQPERQAGQERLPHGHQGRQRGRVRFPGVRAALRRLRAPRTPVRVRRRRSEARVLCRRSRFARRQPGMPPRPGQYQYPQRPGMPYRPPMRQGGQGRPAASQRRDPRPSAPPMPSAPPPVTRTIMLAEGMTVKDLADKLELRVKDVLAKLLMKRLMLTINSTLDPETATMIAREFGAEVTAAQLRRGAAAGRRGRRARRGCRDARAGRHGDGPRRSRQDQSARRHPRSARRRARSRRHHAAHRRVSRDHQQPEHRVPRHAGSRGVHPHARPRREGDRHRRPRRRGRRRGDAADAGSDRPREGGERADRRGDQQDRQGERQPRAREARAHRARPDAGRMGRQDGHGGSVRASEDQHRPAARDDPALERHPRAQGESEEERLGHGARGQARQGPRSGGDDSGAGRHAERRRHVHCRPDRRARARVDRRSRPSGQVGGAVDARRSPGLDRAAPARRRLPDAGGCRQGPANRDVPAGAGQDPRARGEGRPPDARVAAGADRGRRHEGAADHHQGRRAGIRRGARRHARRN